MTGPLQCEFRRTFASFFFRQHQRLNITSFALVSHSLGWTGDDLSK